MLELKKNFSEIILAAMTDVWTFWLLNSNCIFRSLKCDLRLSFFIELYENFISEFLSFIEINFDFQ